MRYYNIVAKTGISIADLQKNMDIECKIHESIGKLPYRKNHNILTYKFDYNLFLLTDNKISKLQYGIEYLITNISEQHVFIPKNTDISKKNYDIINIIDILEENFVENIGKLIDNVPCVMIVIKLNNPSILYFQTKNSDNEWQYTIVDFKNKTIKSIPYYSVFNTPINMFMKQQDIIDICGEPLFKLKSMIHNHITTFIYSFSDSYNVFYDGKIDTKNQDENKKNQLHELYSAYYLIVTFDKDKIINIDMKSQLKYDV